MHHSSAETQNYWNKPLEPILRESDSFGLRRHPPMGVSAKLPNNVTVSLVCTDEHCTQQNAGLVTHPGRK